MRDKEQVVHLFDIIPIRQLPAQPEQLADGVGRTGGYNFCPYECPADEIDHGGDHHELEA